MVFVRYFIESLPLLPVMMNYMHALLALLINYCYNVLYKRFRYPLVFLILAINRHSCYIYTYECTVDARSKDARLVEEKEVNPE